MKGDLGTILFVAYSYPPRPLSASIRPSALGRHLRRMGYRVNVVTSRLWGDPPDEPGPGTVVRTRDLVASPLNRRRPNVDNYLKPGGAPYREEVTTLNRILVPDLAALTWTPFALPAAVRMAKRERIDCVITTSGPESAHVVGARLRRLGIPWIADLRDGWRFEPYRSWETRPQEAFDAWLERELLPRADHVTTVTEPITRDIRDRLGLAATTIPNGYEPGAPVPHQGEPHPALSPNRFSLVHTGKLATAGRQLEPLLAAMRSVVGGGGGRRVELILAGPVSEREAALVDSMAPSGLVRRLGPLTHEDSLRLQRDADGLLLLMGSARSAAVPSKFYEYLLAGRPVLVLGDDTEAGRVAQRTRSGVVAPFSDVEGIAAALRTMASGADDFDPDAGLAAREAFAYPRLAERMAEVVESVRPGGTPSPAPIRQASP